jgi:hypothetical protein
MVAANSTASATPALPRPVSWVSPHPVACNSIASNSADCASSSTIKIRCMPAATAGPPSVDTDRDNVFHPAGGTSSSSATSSCDVPWCGGLSVRTGQAADIKPQTFLTTATVEPERSSMIMHHCGFCGGRSADATALVPGSAAIAVLTGVRAPRREFPQSCFSLSRNRCQPASRASLLMVSPSPTHQRTPFRVYRCARHADRRSVGIKSAS